MQRMSAHLLTALSAVSFNSQLKLMGFAHSLVESR